MEKPNWIKEKIFHPNFEIIQVPKRDSHGDFRLDKGCYVLIKFLLDTYEMAVAICNYKHEILKEFGGTKS